MDIDAHEQISVLQMLSVVHMGNGCTQVDRAASPVCFGLVGMFFDKHFGFKLLLVPLEVYFLAAFGFTKY